VAIVTKTAPVSSKISPVSMDRNTAQVRAPAETTGQAENKIEIRTYQTKPGPSQILYNGDRMWAQVTLTLTTAGPVAVGEQSNITPVLQGKGLVLQTNVPVVFKVAKGNRLYIASDTVNRVNVTIEAYPFLETITGLLTALAGVARAPLAGAIAAITGGTRR
jgi:hypothetical protein